MKLNVKLILDMNVFCSFGWWVEGCSYHADKQLFFPYVHRAF